MNRTPTRWGSLAFLVLFACSTPNRDPVAPRPAHTAGQWITAAQPWRLPFGAATLAVDGEIALVVGASGVATVDLATGTVVIERELPEMLPVDAARLRDGRWIVVGLERGRVDGPTVAFMLDSKLAPTTVPLATHRDREGSIPQVEVMSNGGVVITGRGLPLAVYDPTTWTPTVLDRSFGWAVISARGRVLLATRNRSVERFDLETDRRTPLGLAYRVLQGKDVVVAQPRGGQPSLELGEPGGATKPLAEPTRHFAIDGSGTRLVTTGEDEIRIHSLPDGVVTKRFALPDGLPKGLTANGSRVVFVVNNVLRVLDLDRGTLSPAPADAKLERIAVGTDGTVVVFGARSLSTFAGGKPVATESYGGGVFAIGDDKRYAVHHDKRIELRAIGGAKPLDAWELDDNTSVRLVNGGVVFSASDDASSTLVDARRRTVMTLHREADLLDLDGDDALISLEGRVGLGTRGTTASRVTLNTPECHVLAGTIEHGGKRVLLSSDRDLTVWDRTGALRGSLHAPLLAHPRFVPGRSEILFAFNRSLVVWEPGKVPRAIKLGRIVVMEVSSDGTWLAVALADGRIALFDVADLVTRASKATPFESATIPDRCGHLDPFAPPGGSAVGEESGDEGD